MTDKKECAWCAKDLEVHYYPQLYCAKCKYRFFYVENSQKCPKCGTLGHFENIHNIPREQRRIMYYGYDANNIFCSITCGYNYGVAAFQDEKE